MNNYHNRSQLFGSYLLSINATNIQTITIQRQDGLPGHEAILWNGTVYDTTATVDNQIVYNMDLKKYLAYLKTKGFDDMVITKPFIQELNKKELCEVMANE